MSAYNIVKQRLNEGIVVDINVGDTILGGKFKNKRIVVKEIGTNDRGDITINGRPLMKYRIIPKVDVIDESILSNVRKSVDRIIDGIKVEKGETKEMVGIFYKLLNSKLDRNSEPSPEEILSAVEQLKDVSRMAVIFSVELMPMGTSSNLVLSKVAKKYGVRYFPSAFTG